MSSPRYYPVESSNVLAADHQSPVGFYEPPVEESASPAEREPDQEEDVEMIEQEPS